MTTDPKLAALGEFARRCTCDVESGEPNIDCPNHGDVDARRYPECEKVQRSREEMRTIAIFLEWLESRYVLATRHDHESANCEYQRVGGWDCGLEDGDLLKSHKSTLRLIEEFFEIDVNRLEEERRLILEAQRSLNEKNGRKTT